MEPIRNSTSGNQMPVLAPLKKQPSEGQQTGNSAEANSSAQDTVTLSSSAPPPPNTQKVGPAQQYLKMGRLAGWGTQEAAEEGTEPASDPIQVQSLPENKPESNFNSAPKPIQADMSVNNLTSMPDAALQSAVVAFKAFYA